MTTVCFSGRHSKGWKNQRSSCPMPIAVSPSWSTPTVTQTSDTYVRVKGPHWCEKSESRGSAIHSRSYWSWTLWKFALSRSDGDHDVQRVTTLPTSFFVERVLSVSLNFTVWTHQLSQILQKCLWLPSMQVQPTDILGPFPSHIKPRHFSLSRLNSTKCFGWGWTRSCIVMLPYPRGSR